MSTEPGPTRKADGSPEASVADIADLLVEGGSQPGRVAGDQHQVAGDQHQLAGDQHQVAGDQPLDDGLDVMLETPGPVLVSTFMPPPPSPVADDAEESEGGEEPGEETNLAYEDLLAKLVLPAKAPEPVAAMPAVAEPLPLPAIAPSADPTPPAVTFTSPSSASFEVSPPNDERTLVTDNPLVAEEQEAAFREGRSASRDHYPIVIQEEMRSALTEPMVAANGEAAKSRWFYMMMGGSVVLVGMALAVLVVKLIMPTPAAQPTVLVMPAPSLPPPAPPAHVEPLPPSAPPVAAMPPPAAVDPASHPNPAPAVGEGMAPENEKVPPQARKPTPHKVAHVAVPKPTPAPKPAFSPKAAAAAPKASPEPVVAPAAKAPKAVGGKKAKSSGYADPFDN